jgi:lysozyme family protein
VIPVPPPSDAFLGAFGALIQHEGGYVNDPRDPGGATNHGVSLRFLRTTGLVYDLNRDGRVDEKDIRLVSLEDARRIYRTQFWDAIRADELAPALALLVFDSAVHNGVGQATRWLQRAVGAREDGQLGPLTLAAVHGTPDAAARFHAIRVYETTRMAGWPTYSRGWAIRLCALPFQAAALQEAWERRRTLP